MEEERSFDNLAKSETTVLNSLTRLVLVGLLFLFLIVPVGCQGTVDPEKAQSKPPKPVSVMKLNRTKQFQRQLITGTIAPWKTESIGFEVSGRVSFVIEQNDEVHPFVLSELASTPTPLAKVTPERFEIAVATADADKQVAERQLESNRVAIEQRIPAAIESAESELEFAKAEYQRAEPLQSRNAISQSEFDAVRNRLSVAESSLASVRAELAQARAERAALQSRVTRASQSIAEARRNLRNATIYSSFRGIVSEVHAAPGSFVNPGDPVVTVQMMDPMLVQFEVSPKDSHNYAKGDILDVLVTESGGNRRTAQGIVYTVDAVADPNSRTYTVTLHIRNRKESSQRASSTSFKESLPRTRRIFALDVAPAITGGQQLLVERSCLHKIGDETVVWRIKNRKTNQASDPQDRVLIVEPVKVTRGSEEIVFLGQWTFVSVQFTDPSVVDLKNDLVTGKLIFAEESLSESESMLSNADDPWAPRAVVLEQQNWQLRAGEVVQVVKSGSSLQRGYFVPMKAILSENGKTFLHIVKENDQGQTVAKRVEVEIQGRSSLSGDSIQVQILPTIAGELADGIPVVIGGSHYLTDDATVNVVEEVAR